MDARFRFAPDILRRLGEELNPSLDQGILELVKNAYDADARRCTIELIDTDRAGGCVRVTDDGDGMDAAAIADGWLVLGRSGKSLTQPTRLGRVPAGSKGLGRLAALRLGTRATLATRPRHAPATEYTLEIDWNAFEGVQSVDLVPLNVVERRRAAGLDPGTEVLLQGVREKISRMEVKRLARALVLLADPFGEDPTAFEPTLTAPEFADLESLVKNKYFTDADFHLSATLDANGKARAEVLDWRGKVLFEATHRDLTAHRAEGLFVCPAAHFDLWAFILTSASFATRASSLQEVRGWLQSFGGVHLYLNGLRVAPYGNAGNDWLDINASRVKSPEERPGTNTSIGRVSVVDTDGRLVQKTDRSGFIEDEPFQELKAFVYEALEWMAKRRLAVAETRRTAARVEAPRRSARTRKGVERAIKAAPARSRVELQQAFNAYDRSREREVEDLRKEVQLYRTLSTAGITAATFAHESSGNPLKVITQSIQTIERRAKMSLGSRYDEALHRPVTAIARSVDALAVLGNATLRLVDHGKRRLGRVDVHAVLRDVLETFAPFLDGRQVNVRTELAPGSPYLRWSQAALESVITNLLNNSLAAFERGDARDRRIVIRTLISGGTLELCLMDNGPGIEGISTHDIWLPGETTRPNGTGLGLTIVKDTIRDLGGRTDAIEHGELGGAEFIVELPILGA